MTRPNIHDQHLPIWEEWLLLQSASAWVSRCWICLVDRSIYGLQRTNLNSFHFAESIRPRQRILDKVCVGSDFF